MKALFVGDIHNHSYMFNDIKKLDKKYKLDKIVKYVIDEMCIVF